MRFAAWPEERSSDESHKDDGSSKSRCKGFGGSRSDWFELCDGAVRSFAFPSVAARERATLEIPFREFSKRGVYRRYWAPYLILAVREPATKVFYVPAYRGVLYLPDPTWDRALVPCASLQFDDEYFYCDDGRLSDEWRSHARWDRTGKTESPWMPPLMQARFTEKRDALVITREDL